MRHGRSKAARRTLQFFQRTIGLRAPYHVLVDGTFLVAIIKFKIPLRDRLDTVLQHEKFSLVTTTGVIEELEKLKVAAAEDKKSKEDVLEETLQWAKQECEILQDIPEFDKQTSDMMDSKYHGIEQSLSPAGLEILKISLAPQSTRKTNYFVACQDETILDVLRSTGKIPVLRLARGSVLLLENPSKAGQMQATQDERKKWGASGSVRDEERALVNMVKKEKRRENNDTQQQPPIQQRRKKRKAKEPNPLSCKKAKKEEKSDSKRRRRRNKSTEAS